MGLKLKLKRIEKGVKQKDLASNIGVSTQYLNALENGRATNPSITVMKKISELLDTSVQELFFSEE
ncbi:putative transcriptional regulator [Hathewaya proteolytica DSM 3090]|uniref:Putative transcriptional regulator n=1 Tax=Hathewaya proteolytica DSM 3090 TaxID=1121331 RepID=A0A1M6NUB4_9CLOT|nr:helix-turn-helix transcriptional regulator [Hathewaya proteolytica]SHJ99317.1 putative transcriptional regulator [Hathewaya proteolytica DSM 3090]